MATNNLNLNGRIAIVRAGPFWFVERLLGEWRVAVGKNNHDARICSLCGLQGSRGDHDQSCRQGVEGTGITANCVAPGPVATELFFAGKTDDTVKRIADACPLGRLGDPNDVSQVVGFLAGDAGEWVNGQVIRVNGGSLIS
ncbi:hypothetical protein M0R45_007144 [Rubus argutus]|uniref:Uncharacterized protein n=1 Tax=Rubus argutus TaxID=59490 RepID=A0AAW1YSY1_RUBAR